MERLTEQQKELIKKMSKERLMLKLIKIGGDEDEIMAMDRQTLLAAWAEAVADGRDQPQPLWDQSVTQQDGEVDERFAFERQKHDDEVMLRREQFEMERERMEMQRQEMMMRQEEMDRQYQRENSITAKVKRWGDCLKNFFVCYAAGFY